MERDYVGWLQQESMLARGAAVASQFAGSGGMSQRPFAHSNPRCRNREGVRLVHGVPHFDDHEDR